MEGYLAQILLFAGNFAPSGWALCQGQIIGIAQNTALFSLLGTNFGGNGINTFGLPDLRGRAVIGPGQGPGLPDYLLGQTGGSNNVTLTTATMPAHSHPITATQKVSSSNPSTDEPAGALLTTGNNNLYSPTAQANGNMSSSPFSMSVTGSAQPFSIRQPYLGLNYVICTAGFFPSRN